MTGAPGIFDTRIAYVAESGFGQAKVERIAIMDSDGTNHHYLTAGDTMVMTPRLSPKAARVAYVSYVGGWPQVRIMPYQVEHAALIVQRSEVESLAVKRIEPGRASHRIEFVGERSQRLRSRRLWKRGLQRASALSPWCCSGDRYAGVPAVVAVCSVA